MPAPFADIRRFYEAGGYVKPRPKTDPLLPIRQALYGSQYYAGGGAVKKLIQRIADTYGTNQGRRIERAADSANLDRFSDKTLSGMFEPNEFGVNRGLYTFMPTNRFEDFAVPITPEAMARDPYRRWETQVPKSAVAKWRRKPGGLDFENYVDNVADLIEQRGLSEPPTLWLGKQGKLPNIVGHEGRHRMRALSELGDDTALVNLRPANYGELAGDPDEVTGQLLSKYFGNDWTKRRFMPESADILGRAPQQWPSEPFAGGGAVKRFLSKLRPPEGYVPGMEGMPSTVNILGVGKVASAPIPDIESAADAYMRRHFGTELDRSPLSPLNEDFSRRVAAEYDAMPNAPGDPRVRRSYDALIDETLAQYKALDDLGYDFKFHTPTSGDPYARSPSLGYQDMVDNRRLWVFPTEQGFGSGVGDSSVNPLLRRVGRIGDLEDATANDAFRLVHDVFGHFGPGNPFFRAPGEERAYQLHRRMFSPEARGAAATELRGQNSWVNYGPFGEQNRLASGADTVYAPQTVNILPDWAQELPPPPWLREGFKEGGAIKRLIKSWKTSAAERLEKEGAELNAGRDIKLPYVSPEVHKRLQTVTDPDRIMFPGIYKDPRDIAAEARQRLIPDPGEEGPMFRLFGHTRSSLDDLAQGNRFMQSIDPPTPPWSAPARGRGADVSDRVLTDRNARRIQDVIGEALEDPQLRATRSWYELSPLYDWMGQRGLGLDTQRGLNTRMGVMSPGSNPITEINRGFHAHYLAPQGRWEDLSRYGALPVRGRPDDFPEDLVGLTPHPYMNTAAMPNLRSFETTGALSSPKHKVPTYVMATDPVWAYAKRPVADAHFTRFMGYPDARGSGQVQGLRKELSNSEYADMVPWWRKRVADPLGMDDRDAQALMWNVGGPQTGVNYIGSPKLEMIANYLDQSAKRLQMPIEDAAYEVLSGRSPGFAGGGAVNKLIRRIADAYGAKQGQRVERAADSGVNLGHYTTEALEDAFQRNPMAGLLTVMRPSEFENFAYPLPKQWMETVPYRGSGAGDVEWGGDYKSYIEGLGNIARGGGFDDIPSLWVHPKRVQLVASPSYPAISGHDGRHRMRALAEMGDDPALVRLRSDDYQGEGRWRLTPSFFEPSRKVLPQSFERFNPMTWFPEQLPTEPFAEGGSVKRDMELYHVPLYWDGWS